MVLGVPILKHFRVIVLKTEILLSTRHQNDADGMANSVDSDQTAA